MRKLLVHGPGLSLVGVALPAQQVRAGSRSMTSRKSPACRTRSSRPAANRSPSSSREPNLDEDRYDPELPSSRSRPRSRRRSSRASTGLNFERWSPDGASSRSSPTADDRRQDLRRRHARRKQIQVYVVSSKGGVAEDADNSPRGVQQIAWSPDSKTIAFATQDEPEKKPGFEKWNQSFEVTLNTDYTMTEAVPPTHLWAVSAERRRPEAPHVRHVDDADQSSAGHTGVGDRLDTGRHGHRLHAQRRRQWRRPRDSADTCAGHRARRPPAPGSARRSACRGAGRAGSAAADCRSCTSVTCR